MVPLRLIGVFNLFNIPVQCAVCANHVSRKNPQNPCSNSELRLAHLVFVVQVGPMRSIRLVQYARTVPVLTCQLRHGLGTGTAWLPSHRGITCERPHHFDFSRSC